MNNPSQSGAASNGRLKVKPAPELVRSANQLEISYAAIIYKGLSLADLAHTVMLAEAGIIPLEASKKLLEALLVVHRIPQNEFFFDPAIGDTYKNRENYINRLIPEDGGWLRTGRARREVTNLAYQMAVRERILAMVGSLVDLSAALLDLAEKNVDTLMPDFTYMQHAQPTTLAHYLLGFVYPILRDFERLQACFQRVNRSSGGIGSVNGSRLPFRRQRLAELLGFDGAITHTRDAMWQADMPVEIMACVVASILSIDRLGEDLQVWSTQEFDLISLADEYCRESVIMPQKKNPYSLAFVRGAAGVLIGQLTAMACVGKTLSGQPDSRIFAYGDVPKALDLAIQTVQLMAGVMKTLTINAPLMASQAVEGYSQATDLAELIMVEAHLPYLAAHRLVGEVVSVASQKRIPSTRISSKLIDSVARQVLGRPVKISAKALRPALQAQEIVLARKGLGGAAPEPMHEMFAETQQAIDKMRSWKTQTENSLADAETNLILLAQRMSANDPD